MTPATWKMEPLSRVCSAPQYGLTASATEDPAGPRFLRITDLRQGTLDWSTVPYCSCDADEASKYRLFKGDIVIARIGATTGKASIVLDPPEAVFASYLIRFRANKGVNPFFLYAFLQSDLYWSWIDGNKDSNLKGGVSASLLGEVVMPVPPPDEQKKIAALVWKIQQAIEIEERLIATARELKGAALRHVFTNGLRVAAPNGEAGVEPSNWRAERLDTCCDVVSSSMSYSELMTAEDSVGVDAVNVMGIKVSDMNLPGNETQINSANLVKRLPPDEARRRTVPANAVVFPKRGAAIATNKKRLTTAWTVLDPNLIAVEAGERIDSRFLYQWFQYFDLRTITEPGPTPQLNKKNLTPLLVPVPGSMEVQRETAHFLDSVDLSVATHERRLRTLREIFGTLLNQLMSGEVSVEDLDIDTSVVTSS
jgi:type I restriction enzyme S subunit